MTSSIVIISQVVSLRQISISCWINFIRQWVYSMLVSTSLRKRQLKKCWFFLSKTWSSHQITSSITYKCLGLLFSQRSSTVDFRLGSKYAYGYQKRMLAKMYLLSFNYDSCQEIDVIRHALNLGMLKYLPTFLRTLISGDFKLFPVRVYFPYK